MWSQIPRTLTWRTTKNKIGDAKACQLFCNPPLLNVDQKRIRQRYSRQESAFLEGRFTSTVARQRANAENKAVDRILLKGHGLYFTVGRTAAGILLLIVKKENNQGLVLLWLCCSYSRKNPRPLTCMQGYASDGETAGLFLLLIPWTRSQNVQRKFPLYRLVSDEDVERTVNIFENFTFGKEHSSWRNDGSGAFNYREIVWKK